MQFKVLKNVLDLLKVCNIVHTKVLSIIKVLKIELILDLLAVQNIYSGTS